MKFGRTYWVFLNSQRVALELLEKRAVKYSSRQRLPMAQEIVSGGRRTLLMPYNDLWRRERRVMHQILNISQQVVFKPLQELESRALLHDYLTSPTLWYRANGRYSNSVIMNVVFGQRTSLDDPKMVELFEMSEAFVRFLMPGASIVDTFPVLASNSLLRSLQPWVRKGEYIYRQTIR